MNELAVELNDVLTKCTIGECLSDYGKRMYFPKGIVAQSAAAKAKATNHNATVGQAFINKQPLYLSTIYDCFDDTKIEPSEIFTYAPGAGLPELRDLWLVDMLKKNPTLNGKKISRPIVTSGLTHAIAILLRMFLDSEEKLLLPDLFWDNYDLIARENTNADIETFPLYDESGLHFNLEGFEKAIEESESNKIVTLLNFPNNPTGYTPTVEEMSKIRDVLVRQADKGKKLVVISDDAYFGLFYEENTSTESLFALLADCHENILAIKGDAATKEAMVWGFRIGFITYSCKGMTDEMYSSFEKKLMGSIRCSVSNCTKPGQSLLIKALKDEKTFGNDKIIAKNEMEKRYLLIKSILDEKKDITYIKPLAFNSGYFLSFECEGSVDELRVLLLEKYGVGVINIMDKVLRVAYCSVDSDKIPDLFDIIYKAAGELWS
jgi:aspartate/methionine/tyrosine aminotransferase